jgi:hypothetical protein
MYTLVENILSVFGFSPREFGLGIIGDLAPVGTTN